MKIRVNDFLCPNTDITVGLLFRCIISVAPSTVTLREGCHYSQNNPDTMSFIKSNVTDFGDEMHYFKETRTIAQFLSDISDTILRTKIIRGTSFF